MKIICTIWGYSQSLKSLMKQSSGKLKLYYLYFHLGFYIFHYIAGQTSTYTTQKGMPDLNVTPAFLGVNVRCSTRKPCIMHWISTWDTAKIVAQGDDQHFSLESIEESFLYAPVTSQRNQRAKWQSDWANVITTLRWKNSGVIHDEMVVQFMCREKYCT